MALLKLMGDAGSVEMKILELFGQLEISVEFRALFLGLDHLRLDHGDGCRRTMACDASQRPIYRIVRRLTPGCSGQAWRHVDCSQDCWASISHWKYCVRRPAWIQPWPNSTPR